MSEICIDRWKYWNDLLNERLYHEIGFLMLGREKFDSKKNTYERASIENLKSNGYITQRLDSKTLKTRFPAINSKVYTDANFNPKAGYIESALAVEKLAKYARSLGVTIHEGQTACEFQIQSSRLNAVKTKEGNSFECGHTIVAAGAHTPFLLPDLQPFMKITGHPVFWLKVDNNINYIPPQLCVFTADISNTGWYGFPYHPKKGIIKIAKHTQGLVIHPDKDDRRIKEDEVNDLRQFIAMTLPELINAPLVYTRRCLYTDTLDGHFWIDNHPEIKGMTISSGGSGHGFKMGPVIGEMTADVAEGKEHQFSNRYNWRNLSSKTTQQEEARYILNRKL